MDDEERRNDRGRIPILVSNSGVPCVRSVSSGDARRAQCTVDVAARTQCDTTYEHNTHTHRMQRGGTEKQHNPRTWGQKGGGGLRTHRERMHRSCLRRDGCEIARRATFVADVRTPAYTPPLPPVANPRGAQFLPTSPTPPSPACLSRPPPPPPLLLPGCGIPGDGFRDATRDRPIALAGFGVISRNDWSSRRRKREERIAGFTIDNVLRSRGRTGISGTGSITTIRVPLSRQTARRRGTCLRVRLRRCFLHVTTRTCSTLAGNCGPVIRVSDGTVIFISPALRAAEEREAIPQRRLPAWRSSCLLFIGWIFAFFDLAGVTGAEGCRSAVSRLSVNAWTTVMRVQHAALL